MLGSSKDKVFGTVVRVRRAEVGTVMRSLFGYRLVSDADKGKEEEKESRWLGIILLDLQHDHVRN